MWHHSAERALDTVLAESDPTQATRTDAVVRTGLGEHAPSHCRRRQALATNSGIPIFLESIMAADHCMIRTTPLLVATHREFETDVRAERACIPPSTYAMLFIR